jgi:hypothetical protein
MSTHFFMLIFLTSFTIFTYPAYQTITPGVLYKNILLQNPAESIHILKINPLKVSITIGVADNKCTSAQRVSQIAQHNNAIAAINGNFFDFGNKHKYKDIFIKLLSRLGLNVYYAYPAFTLRNEHGYYAVSDALSGYLKWNNTPQKPLFSIEKTRILLTINGKQYPVQTFNKPYAHYPALYSHCYGNPISIRNPKVDTIVIKNQHIQEIQKNSSDTTNISSDSWVYIVPKKYRQTITSFFAVGDHVDISFMHKQKKSMPITSRSVTPYIIASTPLLIFNGDIIPMQNKKTDFYIKRHPRSAVGVLKNGQWIFLVVDGHSQKSAGMTIHELALFMIKMGCVYALNLDGGGSSTMVINNKVVNNPSDKLMGIFGQERLLSNALLIKKK